MAFKKGNKPWNKGVPRPPETIEKIRQTKLGSTPWNKGKKTGQKVWNKGLTGYTTAKKGKRYPEYSGEKSGTWKGDFIGYAAIHIWLKTKYGKADCCENSDCVGESKFFQWCLRAGKKYQRKRENFIKMCVSCHRRYDIEHHGVNIDRFKHSKPNTKL